MSLSKPTEYDVKCMKAAIDIMKKAGVIEKTGGPFGAVVANSTTGEIISCRGNSVIRDNDPTCHAEMNALREACQKLGTWNLSGYKLYTSCAPCPMCYSASYWARLDKVYYAARCEDYEDLFDDVAIYKDLDLPMAQRQLKPEELLRAEANQVWDEFRKLPDGARY